MLIAEPDAWFTYYYWLDDARAPDYARTVDIHRKPGYDPVELFLDPAIRVPPLAIGSRLVRKKLGFRTLLDVIPLDASLVKGSHGRIPDDPAKGPLLMTRQPDLLGDGELAATDVHDLILRHLGVRRPGGGGAMTDARPQGRPPADRRRPGRGAHRRHRLRAAAPAPPRAAGARPRATSRWRPTLLGARLGAPLVVSAMTGGTDEAADDQRPAGARGVRARARRWCSAPAARCSTTRSCCRPTAAATGRRCCSATSAPPRSARPTRRSARSGSSSCSTPTA